MLVCRAMGQAEQDIRSFITTEFLSDRPDLEFTDDENLLDAEVIDSLGIMLLVDYLESHFKVDIDAEDVVVDNFETIKAITALVQSKQSA